MTLLIVENTFDNIEFARLNKDFFNEVCFINTNLNASYNDYNGLFDIARIVDVCEDIDKFTENINQAVNYKFSQECIIVKGNFLLFVPIYILIINNILKTPCIGIIDDCFIDITEYEISIINEFSKMYVFRNTENQDLNTDKIDCFYSWKYFEKIKKDVIGICEKYSMKFDMEDF